MSDEWREKKIDAQLVTRHLSLPHRGCFLTFAGTKIIQSGAANASLLLHLDLCNARRVQRENALDTFTVGDAAHGECFIQPAAFAPDDDSGEYLDSFLVSLHNPCMNADAVADLECVRVGFLLFFLDRIDDLVHKNSLPERTQSFQHAGENCN